MIKFISNHPSGRGAQFTFLLSTSSSKLNKYRRKNKFLIVKSGKPWTPTEQESEERGNVINVFCRLTAHKKTLNRERTELNWNLNFCCTNSVMWFNFNEFEMSIFRMSNLSSIHYANFRNAKHRKRHTKFGKHTINNSQPIFDGCNILFGHLRDRFVAA